MSHQTIHLPPASSLHIGAMPPGGWIYASLFLPSLEELGHRLESCPSSVSYNPFTKEEPLHSETGSKTSWNIKDKGDQTSRHPPAEQTIPLAAQKMLLQAWLDAVGLSLPGKGHAPFWSHHLGPLLIWLPCHCTHLLGSFTGSGSSMLVQPWVQGRGKLRQTIAYECQWHMLVG